MESLCADPRPCVGVSPAGGGRGAHLLPPHWPRRQGGQGQGEGEGEGEEDGDDPRVLASCLTLDTVFCRS